MSFMSFDYAIRASEAQMQYQQGMAQNMQSVESQVRETGNRNATKKDDLVRNKIEAEYEAKSAQIKAKYADKKAVLAEERKKWAMITAIAVPAAGVVGGWIDNAMGEDAFGRNGVMGQVPEHQQIGLNEDDVASGNVRAYNLRGATGGGGDDNTNAMAIGGYNPRQDTFEFFAVNPDNGEINNGMQMDREEMARALMFQQPEGDPPVARDPAVVDQAFISQHIDMSDPSNPIMKTNSPGLSEDLNAVLRTGEGAGVLRDSFTQHGYYVPNAGPVYQATSDSIGSVMGAITESRNAERSDANYAVFRDMDGMNVDNFSHLEEGVGDDLDRRAGPQTSFASKVFKPILANVSQFVELAKAWKDLADEAEKARLAAEQAKEQAALAFKRLGELTGQIDALGTE